MLSDYEKRKRSRKRSNTNDWSKREVQSFATYTGEQEKEIKKLLRWNKRNYA